MMFKKSLKTALIFGLGAAVGKGLYLLLNPNHLYSAPTWLVLAVPFAGAFIGAFVVTMLIEFIRSKV